MASSSRMKASKTRFCQGEHSIGDPDLGIPHFYLPSDVVYKVADKNHGRILLPVCHFPPLLSSFHSGFPSKYRDMNGRRSAATL